MLFARARKRIRDLRRLQAARVAAFRHAEHCPLAPAFIPVWAVGGPREAPRDRTVVHHPPEPCALCGTPVVRSTRANRPQRYKRATGNRAHVYCSPEHKAIAAHPAPAPKKPPAAPKPPIAAEPKAPPPCPRPDKRAFATEEECREAFRTLFATDGQLHAYPCPCGWWHAGHPYVDDAQRIAAIARITPLKEKHP